MWVENVLSDPRNLDLVDGVAVHWYMDEAFWYLDEALGLPHALDLVHEAFPDKFILYTEACTGECVGVGRVAKKPKFGVQTPKQEPKYR